MDTDCDMVCQRIVDDVVSEIAGHEMTAGGSVEWLKHQDRSAHQMIENLAAVSEIFGSSDSLSLSTGYRRELLDFNLEDMQQVSNETLCKKQEEKLKELQKAIEVMKDELQAARQTKKKETRMDHYINCTKNHSKKSQELHFETRDMEKRLAKYGFHEAIGDQAMGQLEDSIQQKKSTLQQLESDLMIFQDLDPSEASIKKAIRLMKEEMDETSFDDN